MRKLFGAVIALFAVFAFSAIAVGSASASETEPVFLLNKAEITAEQATEATGELELVDLKAVLGTPARVLCSGILLGAILPPPETDHVIIKEVLNLLKEPLGNLTAGLAAECTNLQNCAEPLVYPVNLPWLGLLEFMAGHEWKWLLILEEEGKGRPGWETECMSLGITDTCTSEVGKAPGLLIENMVGGDLLAVFLGTELEEEGLLGECTLGGAKSALVNSDEESGLIEPVGGGELEVS